MGVTSPKDQAIGYVYDKAAFGGTLNTVGKGYWDEFYESFPTHRPSPFCDYVVGSLLTPDDFVVEIGCGNGRDGLLLSSTVRHYHGLDISHGAIAKAQQSFAAAGVDPSRFRLSVRDFSQVEFEREESDRLVIYSRFSLHADTDEAQELLLQHVSSIPGRVLFLVEARTIHDELYGQGTMVGRHSYVTDHFRRFIDPDEFRARVAQDFMIEDLSVDRGYAMYGDEDPPVLRAVLSRGQDG